MMDSSWRHHAGEWSGDVIDNARRTEQTALRTSARHIDQTTLTSTLFTTDGAIPSATDVLGRNWRTRLAQAVQMTRSGKRTQ